MDCGMRATNLQKPNLNYYKQGFQDYCSVDNYIIPVIGLMTFTDYW